MTAINKAHRCKLGLLAVAVPMLASVLALLAATEPASAQANCNVLPHGQARANCYGRQSQIYMQQSQQYNAIAQQQYQTHVRVGNALRYAPVVGRYAAPAWNAPRYYYNARYGRP